MLGFRRPVRHNDIGIGESATTIRAGAAERVFVLILLAIGVVRIVSTYSTFSETWDEPAHVATGMEWLQSGTYTLEPMHPPLARAATAVGPYLAGIRLDPQLGMWGGGNAILAAGNQYRRNLALARLGVLPFFVAGAFLTWYWARSRYGIVPAALALMFYTTCPVILGHAGLATTDTAAAAGFLGALLGLVRWLEKPAYGRAAIFGAAAGLGVLCKFSVPGFLLAAGAGLWVWRLALRASPQDTGSAYQRARSFALAVAVAGFVLWSGYRFSTAPLESRAERPHSRIDKVVGHSGVIHDLAYAAVEFEWTPARPFIRGLAQIKQKEAFGQKSFLLGQIRRTGWWCFFPVAIAVKTPIPLLLCAASGLVLLLRASWIKKDWTIAAPAIGFVAGLLLVLPQNLSIGVRHVLPLYPLLAIMAGIGAWQLWNGTYLSAAARRSVVLLLMAWQAIASARAHPDYLAYFNEFAGNHPEKILIASDLDWGQDLFRLSSVLKAKQIPSVSIAYSGPAELEHVDLPPFRTLNPYEHANGWIAIGMMRRFTGGVDLPNGGYAWLSSYQPVELVGRSILLYYIPDRPE